MTLAAALTLPKTVTRAMFPEADQRIWLAILAIMVFAALGLKEAALPVPLVIAAAVAGAIVLIVRSRIEPEPVFYALVAYLPFSRVLTPSGGTGIPMLSLINVLIVFTLVAWVRTQPKLEWPWLAWPILAFIALNLCSIAVAALRYGPWYLQEYAVPVLRMLKICGYFWLAFWVVRDARGLKTVLALIAVAVTAVGLMAGYEYWDRAGSNFEDSRVQGIAGHANTMGAFFVSYMFLLASRFLTQSARSRNWPWLAGFLVCVRGIMVTFSRAAYAGVVVAGLVFCWFRSKRLFLAVLALIAVVALNPHWLPPGVRYRLEMTVVEPKTKAPVVDEEAEDIVLETSAASRGSLWRAAVQAAKDRPVWGLGPGLMDRFMPLYTQGAIGQMDAHNSFLNIAAETGVPAAAAFAAIFVAGAFCAWQLYRRTKRTDEEIAAFALGLLAGLVGLAVVNCSSTTMDSEEATGYVWILLGLAARAAVLHRQGVELKGQA